MEAASAALWRRRLQDLARGAGQPHAPMFAPLLFGVGAQIDAIGVPEMVVDATRLRKNLAALRGMLALPSVSCAVPSLMELQALGGAVDSTVWPPRQAPGAMLELAALSLEPLALLRSARLAASLDAVRQFAAADTGEPVIAVALTGPATLVAQLRSATSPKKTSEALYELAGGLLATLARLYCEAGVHLLQLHEAVAPGAEEDAWRGALGTAGNVARFHRVAPLLVFAQALPAPAAWPAQAVPCVEPGADALPTTRLRAQRWPDDPAHWPALPAQAGASRVITTAAEVQATLPLAELLGQVHRVRETA